MSHIEVNRQSSVVGSAQAEINAPIESVWQILSTFENWPTWNSSVSSIQLHGPVEVGTSFAWVAGGAKIISRIEEIQAPTRLVWSGKTFGIKAIHVWKFEEKDEGTAVFTEESFDGVLAKVFPGVTKKMLVKALEQGVTALKQEAEVRHAKTQA